MSDQTDKLTGRVKTTIVDGRVARIDFRADPDLLAQLRRRRHGTSNGTSSSTDRKD